MMKKLSILLIALAMTSAIVAGETATETVKKTETKKMAANGKQRRMSKKSNKMKKSENKAGENSSEAVLVDDSYTRGGGRGYSRGGGCATGRCHTPREHSCRESKSCGVCHRAEIPTKPGCEKFVRVVEPPCLHKQVYYSWTCPTDTKLVEGGDNGCV
jgi:hypothetical protein